MNPIDRNKILKMLGIIAVIFMAVGIANYFRSKNSMTLEEYAAQQGETVGTDEETEAREVSGEKDESRDVSGEKANENSDAAEENSSEKNSSEDSSSAESSSETEADTPSPTDEFYYTTLSNELIDRITGVSYPATETEAAALAVSYDDLRYVHILHYDFDGEVAEGELICNASIADDLLEIFYELYRNEYQIEKVRLIDEYDGDDIASMADNNTSCFNYRVVDGTETLSKHALGLAIDINPLYNPYLTYNTDGTQNVSPASGEDYADRTRSFPYKIDENDLCYRLFTEHGFTWGGNWNSVKDYQHFQKTE